MELSKEEFATMLMLYVANSDGRVDPAEVRLMLEKTTPAVYKEMKRRFAQMNDAEVLQCISENKQLYASTEEERRQILSDLKAIIEADGKLSPIEEVMLRGVEGVIE